MSFQDKSIRCSDCGATFTFTTGEQEFFQPKVILMNPGAVRHAARQRNQSVTEAATTNSYSSSPRQMYPVKCAECGKDTEVPFEPRGDKPVYCSDCYRKVKVTR